MSAIGFASERPSKSGAVRSAGIGTSEGPVILLAANRSPDVVCLLADADTGGRVGIFMSDHPNYRGRALVHLMSRLSIQLVSGLLASKSHADCRDSAQRCAKLAVTISAVADPAPSKIVQAAHAHSRTRTPTTRAAEEIAATFMDMSTTGLSAGLRQLRLTTRP
jgi:hypothetical protein